MKYHHRFEHIVHIDHSDISFDMPSKEYYLDKAFTELNTHDPYTNYRFRGKQKEDIKDLEVKLYINHEDDYDGCLFNCYVSVTGWIPFTEKEIEAAKVREEKQKVINAKRKETEAKKKAVQAEKLKAHALRLIKHELKKDPELIKYLIEEINE